MAAGDSGLQPVNLFMTLFPFIVSSLVVGTRIWRRTVERKFELDDLLLAVAQVMLGGLTVTTWIFIKKSYTGYHTQNIPNGAINTKETGKWRYINAVTYNPILALIKISFLLTLIKLQSPSRLIRLSLSALFVVNVMFLVAGTLSALLICLPIPKFWDPTIPGHCVDKQQYIYSTITVTIITDVLVTLLPAWILYGLQMPLKQKITIICFLSLGLIVTAIASYRLSDFVRILKLKDPLRMESPHNVRTPLSNIEANLAAIAACGPTLKWMLGRFIPFFDSNRTAKSSNDYTRNGSSRFVDSALRRRFHRPTREDATNKHVAAYDKYGQRRGSGSMVEMEDQIGWKGARYRAEADTQSDKQRITGHDDTTEGGILRTIEWQVGGREGRATPTRPRFLV